MVDGYGREIKYARISVTDLCNLRCIYCMPLEGVEKRGHEDILRVEEITNIAHALGELDITKIRLTGGEPLVRKGILEIVENINKIENIKDLAITTNGLLLDDYAKELKIRGVNSINISLDSLNEDKFYLITRGGDVNQVLKGIDAAFNGGFDKIKINVALIKGFNDNEIEDLVGLTRKWPVDVRFIELMAIGQQAHWAINKYISSEIVLKKIPSLVQVKGEDPSSPAVYYNFPGALGKIGLIRPISCKFCNDCNRIRITADGKIKNCLHTDDEIDLKPFTYDKVKLKELLTEAIKYKPYSHSLGHGNFIKRNMVRIGG